SEDTLITGQNGHLVRGIDEVNAGDSIYSLTKPDDPRTFDDKALFFDDWQVRVVRQFVCQIQSHVTDQSGKVNCAVRGDPSVLENDSRTLKTGLFVLAQT